MFNNLKNIFGLLKKSNDTDIYNKLPATECRGYLIRCVSILIIYSIAGIAISIYCLLNEVIWWLGIVILVLLFIMDRSLIRYIKLYFDLYKKALLREGKLIEKEEEKENDKEKKDKDKEIKTE